MKFNEGELILCFHGPLLYEAKILKTFILQNEERYFIHYSGWNKNWDEWVGESRILKITPENIQRQKELKSTIATKCKTKKEKQALHFSKLRGVKGEESSPDGKEQLDTSFASSTNGDPFTSPQSLEGPSASGSSLTDTPNFRPTFPGPGSGAAVRASFAARYLAKKKNFKVTNSSMLVNKGNSQTFNSPIPGQKGLASFKKNRPGLKGARKRMKESSGLAGGDRAVEAMQTFNQTGTPEYSRLSMDFDQSSPCYLPRPPGQSEMGSAPFSPLGNQHPAMAGAGDSNLAHIRIHIPDVFKPLLLDDWDYVTRQQMLVLLPADVSIDAIFEEYLESRKELEWPSAKMYLAEEFVIAIKKYFDCTIGSQLLYSFERPQYADILEQHSGKSLCQVYGGIHLLRLFVNLFENLTQFQLAEPQVTFLVTYLKDFFTHFSSNLNTYIKESHYESAAPEYYRKII